ncbi:chymotrypsin-2-like isoform X2 [Aricia agestis]|nr:chymotrypsin-2-like isoform X2 [Aricia agestis]
MVALVIGDRIKSLMCGGSIITRKDVLTAAHCIEFAVIWGELLSSYQGVVGSYYYNIIDKKLTLQFTGFYIHKTWDSLSIKDDIGILKTAGIPLSDRVEVLPLNFDWIDGAVKCVVTGWGTTDFMMPIPDRLQALNVSTISGAECVRRIREKEQHGWLSPPVEPHREICTYHSPGHGMCNGDSGSALILKKIRSQIGIVSWGFPCAVGAPDMFVRVSAYRRWILDTVGNNL